VRVSLPASEAAAETPIPTDRAFRAVVEFTITGSVSDPFRTPPQRYALSWRCDSPATLHRGRWPPVDGNRSLALPQLASLCGRPSICGEVRAVSTRLFLCSRLTRA
jgi:hypothetical protein